MTPSDPEGGALAESLELIRRLKELEGTVCRCCKNPLCGHEILASIALGAGTAPRCFACLGVALEQSQDRLAEGLRSYMRARGCYVDAWRWADTVEMVKESGKPCCVLGHAPQVDEG